MLDREKLTGKVADFKRYAQKEFDKALAELIALAYKHAEAGADFLWEMDPGLDEEANKILRHLSDTLWWKARALARIIMEDELSDYDFDDAWNTNENDGLIPIITRFDMEGSHLKELLEIWVALAFVNHMSKGELRVAVSRYLANPFASPLWNGLPRNVLKLGRGYAKNVLEQIAVIGQNAIISASRYAEWQDAQAHGAKYYIRRRGSSYHCPECDSMCGYPIPIEEPFIWLHSRCMCWPEYHYE